MLTEIKHKCKECSNIVKVKSFEAVYKCQKCQGQMECITK